MSDNDFGIPVDIATRKQAEEQVNQPATHDDDLFAEQLLGEEDLLPFSDLETGDAES